MYKKIKGALTALITPFKKDLSVDFEGLEEFIKWQVSQGIDGLVPCGTTGECSTLTFEEYCQVISLCVEVVNGCIPVIPGTGANSTAEAIKRTQYAESLKADAVLIVVPYYNKPPQESIYYHFKAIHDETNIPIILYNVPGRCVVDASDVIIARIMELPRVVGLKDATGDLNRPLNLRSLMIDKEKVLLSGEDSTALAFNLHGGCGCISVLSNVMPKACAEMHRLFFSKKFEDAINLNERLFKLSNILFCESNPIPVKYAVSLIHRNLSSELRLPLVSLKKDNRLKIESIMRELSLL